MKNKKIAALLGILLAGSMAFSLSACGNSNDSAASDKSSASASASKADDSSKDDSSDSPVLKRSRSMRSTPTRNAAR